MRLLEMLAAGVMDGSGNVLASGTAYVYVRGTTTLATIYGDDPADGTDPTPISNPVTLNASGVAEAEITRSEPGFRLITPAKGMPRNHRIADIGYRFTYLAADGRMKTSGGSRIRIDEMIPEDEVDVSARLDIRSYVSPGWSGEERPVGAVDVHAADVEDIEAGALARGEESLDEKSHVLPGCGVHAALLL